MGSSHAGRRYNTPFRIKPHLGKVSKDLNTPFTEEAGHVLHKDVTGSHLTHQAGELGPQPPRIACPFPPTSRRNRLAGEPAAEKVNGR